MAFAIIRRVSGRKGFAVADKGHLHHRLMNLGHGHRRSVVILWAWTALLSAFVLYPTLTGRNPTYLPFGIIALAIVLYTVLHPSVRARRRSNGHDVAAVADDTAAANGAGEEHEDVPTDGGDDNVASELPVVSGDQ